MVENGQLNATSLGHEHKLLYLYKTPSAFPIRAPGFASPCKLKLASYPSHAGSGIRPFPAPFAVRPMASFLPSRNLPGLVSRGWAALLAFVLLLACVGLQAQPALSAQANVAFGKVLESSNSGTVVLSPLGAEITTGGATLFGGVVTVLTLEVSGTTGHDFTLQGFPPSLTLSGPGGNVTVDTWVTDLPGNGLTGTFGATPTVIHAGSTLRIPGTPVAGSYSGDLNLLVHDDTSSQSSTSVGFTASATVWNALATTVLHAFNFGAVVVNGAGTLRVNPDGATAASTNIFPIHQVTPSPGSVQITGTPSATFTVTLPGSATLTGPGEALNLDTFSSLSSPSLHLDAGGESTLSVGGTVHFNAGQVHGTYSGSFTVTIAYE